MFEAFWMNGLGEECSSIVRGAFEDKGKQYIVVWDWRASDYLVKAVEDCITVRRKIDQL